MSNTNTFQNIIIKLKKFWSNYGCLIVESCNTEVGAGTLNKHTFLNILGKDPWNIAYVEPSVRPFDGKYGKNINKMQHFYQFQVILKPSPINAQNIFIESLNFVGLDRKKFDIKFIEDDWEHPALGISGVGWEVWCQGIEIAQFTYFQQCGGIPLKKISCEVTYGIERLAINIQKISNIYNLIWSTSKEGESITYGDIHKKDEYQWSIHNFKEININTCIKHFDDYESQVINLIHKNLPLPAYNYIVKCSHIFNLINSKKIITSVEKIRYISKIRNLTKLCVKNYLKLMKEN
jgi:glycyl-tRNA synthetase alpha chain